MSEMQLKLCVLLPGKNEATVIAETLKSVIGARMPIEDIYVVDDGSTDDTAKIAKTFGVNVLSNPKNIGKAHSILAANDLWKLDQRYDVICLMDADSIVGDMYYEKVEAAFRSKPNVAVVSANTKSVKHNWLTAYRCMTYAMSNLIYKQGQSAMGVVSVVPGFAASYSTKAFKHLTWDSDTVVEDMDTTIQVHRKKLGSIVYAPEAETYTQDPNTIPDYAKQIYRWHSGAWQVGKKHKMFSGVAAIDWEFKFLMFEALIFSLIYLMIPIWLLLWPHKVLRMLGIELAVFFVVAALVAIFQKRWDVLYSAPLFIIVRFIDCAILTWSFWRTIVLGKHDTSWNAVKRYVS